MKEYFDKLYKFDKEKFYKLVANNIAKKKKMFIVTANPETFTYGSNNPEFHKLLVNNDTTLVPDGISIVEAARILKYQVKERITGVDLASYLFNLSNEKKYKVALLGASKEVIEALKEKIDKELPNLILVKALDGYQDNKDEFFNSLVKLDVDVILVALGIPQQEELIYKHLAKFKKGIFMGVGGSFDVLSGKKKRAPKIFIKLKLEWLYRLLKEPKRIKRFYQNNVKFIYRTFKLKKNYKK